MKIKVYKKSGIYDIRLLRNKIGGEWTFINLTKGHICPCKFKTQREALDDLQKYLGSGKIEKVEFLNK